MVAGGAHQPQDRVDIPLVFDGELLGQNGDFEDHLLPERVVGYLKVLQQLGDDGLRVGGVAHRVEEVEPSSPNRDILVTERLDDDGLVHLDGIEAITPGGEMCHGVETEVADVGLLGADEATEKVSCRMDDGRLGIEVDGEVDGFEEDRVLSVVVLSVARRLLRVLEDALEDVVEEDAKGAILCVKEQSQLGAQST